MAKRKTELTNVSLQLQQQISGFLSICKSVSAFKSLYSQIDRLTNKTKIIFDFQNYHMGQTKENSPGCKNKITHQSHSGRPDISDMNNKDDKNEPTDTLVVNKNNGQSSEIGEKVLLNISTS